MKKVESGNSVAARLEKKNTPKELTQYLNQEDLLAESFSMIRMKIVILLETN